MWSRCPLAPLLACVAACSFSAPKVDPGSGPGGDAGSDAAAEDGARADAAIDGPEPAWVVVDQLTIPSNGAAVTSSFTLQAGVTYRLRASGTFVIQSPQGTPGDAEYWDFAANQPTDGVEGVDVGLAVNDSTVDANRTPKWGPYNPMHVYEVEWLGTGARIRAQLHDGNYANNTGSLSLAILALP